MAANQEEVKLLGSVNSPFVCRVQIALKLKGIEYKFVEENLANKSDELLKYNPVYKKFLEYIDETWKQNLILPSDPYQRALARFWSKFIDDKIVATSVKVIHTVNDVKERTKNVEESIEALRILENELKDKFFGGEEIGFVDIAAVFIAFWIPLIQDITGLQFFTAEKFPKLHKWSQEFLNHPIVKENIPPRDTLFAYFKAHYDSLIASK